MRRNLSSGLPRRLRTGGMAAFDALPPGARAWLRGAKLPWSAASVRKIWLGAPDPQAALFRLTHIEQATLARDRLAIKTARPDIPQGL